MTTRIVLADDQGLVRAGFMVLVNSAPDLEVVARGYALLSPPPTGV